MQKMMTQFRFVRFRPSNLFSQCTLALLEEIPFEGEHEISILRHSAKRCVNNKNISEVRI